MKKIAITCASVLFLAIIFIVYVLSSPRSFPEDTTFNIEEGESLRGLSLLLKNENIIRSRLAFETFVIAYGGERRIREGYYLFENRIPVFEVARRMARGDRHLLPVRVTIPEGFTVKEMAEAFSSKLSMFNKEQFITLASEKEGYLFPDTYFLFPNDTDTEALKLMEKNYERKIKNIRGDIEKSGKTENEIIVMASIIEKEAKGSDDRNMISGILWNRISIDMPLQADAAPETYQRKGLPEKPIANPGLLAINAAINPTPTDYLFYLHDKTGMIHYAVTYTEHKKNIAKYLK
ncbi:MAG TPA: endolytic transglycosylase MltG [Candidatus Paceibacterota bacterium]|nr:endolytic transglycosylase MltG [Candidatus Paceibacterota bacterium]